MHKLQLYDIIMHEACISMSALGYHPKFHKMTAQLLTNNIRSSGLERRGMGPSSALGCVSELARRLTTEPRL